MRKLKLPGRDKSMPRLNDQDVELIRELGIKEVKNQAREMVIEKLQEPWKEDREKVPKAGNPVYKAMHACRCSSRKKLSMAHKIPKEKVLSEKDIDSVVNLLTRWIAREYNFFKKESPTNQKRIEEF